MTLQQPGVDLLAAAKLWLTSPRVPGGPSTGDMPYLATALYALVTVPTDQVATLATDPAWRLYVNPAWLAGGGLSPATVGAEVAHHVWHLLADHAGRATDVGVRAAGSRAWRVAADVTIHQLLGNLASPERDSGPTSATSGRGSTAGVGPGGPAGPGSRAGASRATGPAMAARRRALSDHQRLVGASELGLPGGRAAEEYYAMLSGLPADPAGNQPGEAEGPAWIPEPPGEGGAGGTDPSCGSGCDGLHRSYELPDTLDTGGVSPATAHALRICVAREFQATGGRGDVPGQWQRWAAAILDPVVDWRTVLHAAVRRGLGWAHGHTDYTYTRISRRQAAAGPVILPALRRPAPRVGVVVDTSASVDDGLLGAALGEIDGVLAALGVADPQVSVLAVDAAVHAVTTVRRADAARMAGGGGTDMALGIAAAQDLRPRVDLIIVLTDGWTGWPTAPPPVPVVAVLIGRSSAELPGTPGWIHRVECVR